MTEIIKLADEIVERDEPHQAKPTMFEHGKKKWKEFGARVGACLKFDCVSASVSVYAVTSTDFLAGLISERPIVRGSQQGRVNLRLGCRSWASVSADKNGERSNRNPTETRRRTSHAVQRECTRSVT